MAKVKTRGKGLKILLRVLVILICILLLWILLSNIYSFYESKKYGYPGEMIPTANGSMHVYTDIQEEGDHTYVFLNAFGGDSAYYDFKILWEPLAQTSSVVTVDYLGYGMSEQTRAQRTLANVVGEIEEALTGSGASGPYTFVAHSMGGFYATGYALEYPEKVEALILVDNTPPAMAILDPTELEMAKDMKPQIDFFRFAGILRFVNETDTPGLTDAEQKAHTYYSNKMILNDTVVNEADNALDNAEYLLDKEVSDDIPMFILVSAQTNEMTIEMGLPQTWEDYHVDLLNGNPRSTYQLFDSAHYIHHEVPEAVLSAIRGFME